MKYRYAYDKNENIVNIADAKKGMLYHCISCNDIMITKQRIFIKIHVTNAISENKEKSKYPIIEIDVDSEDDLRSFESELLTPSEKINFFNFKIQEKNFLMMARAKKHLCFYFLIEMDVWVLKII